MSSLRSLWNFTQHSFSTCSNAFSRVIFIIHTCGGCSYFSFWLNCWFRGCFWSRLNCWFWGWCSRFWWSSDGSLWNSLSKSECRNRLSISNGSAQRECFCRESPLYSDNNTIGIVDCCIGSTVFCSRIGKWNSPAS